MHPNHKQAKDSQKTKLKSMTSGYADGGRIGPKAPDFGSVTGADLRAKDAVGMSYKKIGTHEINVGGGKKVVLGGNISEKDIPHKRGGKV